MRGIDFAHVMQRFPAGVEEILDCLPPAGAGAAAGDVDGDGLDDLFVTSSARGSECALFVADRDGRFADVTAAAGLLGLNDDDGVVTGGALADVDGDGDLDLYVARWGPNCLYLNRGDGRFTLDAGNAADPGNAGAAVFFDPDGDGDPDLYVANLLPDVPVLAADRLEAPAAGVGGAWNGGSNRLYRNDGGRFVDVTRRSGTADTGWSLTAAAGDVDADGDPDLLVGNVYGPLGFYRNDGGFRFTPDRTCFRGGSMSLGVDLGDVDGDLRDDLLVTGLGHPRGAVERSRLWLGREGGEVEEAGDAAGLGLVFRGAGGRFADLDRDGDLDLLFANGFDARDGTLESLAARWVRLDLLASGSPLARFRFPGAASGGRWCVVWNDCGTFVVDRGGGGLAGPGCAVALLDVGGDGRLDAYVACQSGAGALLVHRAPDRPGSAHRGPAHAGSARGDSLARQVYGFERALRRRPLDFRLAADYRTFCLERSLYPRALRFFRELRGPFPVALAIHRLLTHIDGVRRVEEGILVQGASAAMGLVETGDLIRAHPGFWVAHRLRALNYLYWPVEFDKLPRCVADYRRCIELLERSGAAPALRAEVLLELGDAHAKGGEIEEAIRAWQRGRELGPEAPALAARLALSEEQIVATVRGIRSLDHPPPTDIAWIESQIESGPLGEERARAEAGGAVWNAVGPPCRDAPERGSSAAQLLDLAAEEPNDLVIHMLAYGRAVAEIEELVRKARGGAPAGTGADSAAVLLARGWVLLKGALTLEQVEAARQALDACKQRLGGLEVADLRPARYALLARLGIGDAENLLGRLESGYGAWRVRRDLYDEPAVSRRVLIPVELIEQEVWSHSFGQGAINLETLGELLR